MTTTLAPLFSRKTDEWATPQDLYDALDREFHFTLDAAATFENTKCPSYLGPDQISDQLRDSLTRSWLSIHGPSTVWLNPPYSRCKDFMGKAMREARLGHATVVCLVPARTDTQWFHNWVWDERWNRTRDGVELRLLKGRLRFGEATSGAPFPSMIVIFRRWEVAPA